MKILVFNWHESYLHLLSRVGHEWVIADWHRPWNAAFRAVPANARLCSAEAEGAALVESRAIDLVLGQTAMDLAWLGERPAPLLYLTHNALANEIADRDAAQAAALRGQVAEFLARRRGHFATISEMKRASWDLPGDVVPPGIDVEEHGGYTGDLPAVLTVANLLVERAHMLGAAELHAALAGIDWRVVGTNPALGIREAPSWDALRAAYRTHRVYAHATLWPWEDGYNLALLEAMATGMPVVAHANPTSPITEGIDGFLAEDAWTMGRWVRRLLDDGALAARVGEAGRHMVQERFPMQAFCERWTDLLERAASTSRPVRSRASARVSEVADRAPLVVAAPAHSSAVAAEARPGGVPAPAPSGVEAGGDPSRRLKVVLATAWTPISTSTYYARAFRRAHDVLTWGPSMDEATLAQWRDVTEQHALKPSGLAEEKIRMLRGLSRPADVPARSGQPSARELLERLPRGWRPDLFVWIDGGPGFLPLELERLDCPTVCLVGDSHTELEWRLAYARLFASVFVQFNRQHIPRFEAGGCRRVTWLPAACDPEIHRAFDVERAFDVVFVGQTLRQWHPDRVRLLERLSAAGLDVHVTTKILEEMALAFCRGRLVFNRSLAGDLNMRVFEAMATGSLLLTDRLAPESGLEQLFTDRTHLVCYGEDDLEVLARHYLDRADEREAIARAGRAAVLAAHTYAHRVAQIAATVRNATEPSAGAAGGTVRSRPGAPTVVPRASIVIPVYNRAELTARCLAALVRTVDAATTEVIVVDNASSDDTAAVLARSPLPVRVLRNAENRGFAAAVNQGAQAARGRLLVLLNNDTEPEAGWLDALWTAAQPEEVGIVGCRLLYPGTRRIQHAGLALTPEGIPDHVWRNAPEDDPRACAPRDVDMVTGACLAMSRELFCALGGLDEAYRNGVEDVDLCLSVRRRGLRVRYEPRAVVLHHEGASEGRFAHVVPNLRRLADKWGETLAALPRLPREEFGSTPGPLVAWEGSFFLHHSLAGINRAVCAELTRAGVDLTLTPFEADEIDPAALPEGPRLAALMDRPAARRPSVRVRHRFPPDFARREGERLACIQPWEFGAVPTAWAAAIRQSVDELWVPSEFVRKSFIAGGVPADRVVTIPNGFDPAVFHADAPPRTLPTGKSFRFLFVGGTIHRKGIDLLLRAYAEEFTAADDVALIVKDHAYYRHRIDGALEALRRRPGAPEIVYLHDNVAPGELGGLYTACDWLVHPFRGEGFGLPVLEALACARPVIVTDAGPIREYCPADSALFVPARTTGFPDASIDGLPTVGVPTLVEPDLGALRWAMRTAYESGEGGRALGRRGAEHVHAHYTWRQIATHYAARLRALCGSPEETAPPVAAPSSVPAAPAVASAPAVAPAPASPARRTPHRSELEVHHALTLIAEGHLAEGLRELSAVLDRDPANVGALVGAAHCALVVDDTANARALLTRVLELEPEHSGARAALGVLDGAAAEDAAAPDPALAHEAL